MPCARSLAPVLGAVVVYGTSCVRWYVACSARRSHRRARSRDTRSHVGACPGHRARPNRRYGCAVAWMAYSIVVPHCLSMVSCPGSAVRSNTTCKKRYMDVNFHVHPPQLGEGPMCMLLQRGAVGSGGLHVGNGHQAMRATAHTYCSAYRYKKGQRPHSERRESCGGHVLMSCGHTHGHKCGHHPSHEHGHKYGHTHGYERKQNRAENRPRAPPYMVTSGPDRGHVRLRPCAQDI